MQPLDLVFRPEFKGKLSQYGLDPNRRTPTGIRAAIIREKGTNGEREMAYSLYLAGFDVKDVTMFTSSSVSRPLMRSVMVTSFTSKPAR